MPEEAIRADSEAFAACGYDLDVLVRQRLSVTAASRLSVDRVRATLHPDNPEFANMLAVAEGLPLPTDPAYQPNGEGVWPGLSCMSRAAAAPITKMFHDGMHAKGQAIYLKSAVVRRYIRDAGLSAAGWATAAGKRKGRAK